MFTSLGKINHAKCPFLENKNFIKISLQCLATGSETIIKLDRMDIEKLGFVLHRGFQTPNTRPRF